MNSFSKIMKLVKTFWSFHFAIKWNILVAFYVVYSLFFGGATWSSSLVSILVANLYALPMYVAMMRGVEIHGDLLLAIALGVLLLGYFISFYLTGFIWVIVMAILFKHELLALTSMIKK